jgi:hypothetical protein
MTFKSLNKFYKHLKSHTHTQTHNHTEGHTFFTDSSFIIITCKQCHFQINYYQEMTLVLHGN